MSKGINYTKDAIKSRMLKHALTFWSIKNPEELDPVVKLMMEALSNELYNLSNNVKDAETRILEKIANLLAPDFLTCPNPAHAIMHAMPAEATETVTYRDDFFMQKKISSGQDETPDTSLDVFFTAAASFQLTDTRIDHIATPNHFYSYDPNYNKQMLSQAAKGYHPEPQTLWLGLSLNAGLDRLQNLSFYFDWKHTDPAQAKMLYQLLPLCKWFCAGKELTATLGIPTKNTRSSADPENIFIDYDLLSLMEKDICQLYDHKFISIDIAPETSIQELKETMPTVAAANFPASLSTSLKDKKLWLKIVFPSAMPAELLDELYVYSNCFPVMNRQLNELKYRLKGGSNIVPLKTGPSQQFLAVQSFSDNSHTYRNIPYRKTDEEEVGTYSLRSGGIERFDNRNAREMIGYLLELLRSESSAFSVYGYDFIAGTLKEMDQKIALMEQKTASKVLNVLEIPHYIVAKPFEGNDVMHVEYWTTLSEAANNIRSGTVLQQHSGSKVKSGSVMLMSASTGGKNRLRPAERLNAFRYGLISRNRIVTKEDIRNYCLYEMGNRISGIRIDKGFEMLPEANQAFVKTIDIFLTPGQGENLDAQEWEVLCSQLKTKLEARSGMSNYYRVLTA